MCPTENEQRGDTSALEGTSLESLLKDVRRLTLRNEELESALELASRKVAIYESFDDSIRDAMAYSLRVAFEIREKAEREANEVVARARHEEALLREQVSRLVAECDALIAERDALHKSLNEVRSELEREGARHEGRRGERSQLLSEVSTLERRLREIRDDLESLSQSGRSTTRGEAESPARAEWEFPTRELDPAVDRPAPAQPSDRPVREESESLSTDGWRTMMNRPEILTTEPEFDVKKPSAIAPEPELDVRESRIITKEPGMGIRDRADVRDHVENPLSSHADKGWHEFLKVVPSQTEAPASEPSASFLPVEREKASSVELDEASVQGGRPGSPPSPPVVQSSSEVELVVSPVHSFPKLVELERALQTLPEVKSFYVRDFRYGVATLLVRLTRPEARDDLPARLEEMPGWNLVILSSPPHRIEAKIGA